MRVRVRKSFKVAPGVSARANAKGTIVVLGGKGCIVLVLLALVLSACGGGRPSPSPIGTSPSPTGTSPSPSPTGSNAAAFSCITSNPSGGCGAYHTGSTNSNGYNTYVDNNCWADPACHQTLSADSFGDWQVTANEPAGNSSVKTAPLAQQLLGNWCAADRNWENLIPGGCGGQTSKVPISALSQLTSTYAETAPHNGQTIAEWAWDDWLDNDSGYPNEVMVWVDNNNRCNDLGAQVAGSVTIGGQKWTPYQYSSGEFIWSLGTPGACAQQSSGTVDLLALLKWMQAHGHAAADATISEVDGTWEICSTGGVPETFRVSSYSISAKAA